MVHTQFLVCNKKISNEFIIFTMEKIMGNLEEIILRMKSAANVSSNSELSIVLGVGKSMVSNWRARGTTPYEACYKLTTMFDVEMEWLIEGKTNNSKPSSLSENKLKEAIMEGLFSSTQIRAITLNEDMKIGTVADILMSEIAEKHPEIFEDSKNKTNKAV